MANNTAHTTVFAPWADTSVKPMIRFEGVTKRYGAYVAIDNLTLDIYEREFYALLGPSGCGKTTLLRLLAGFEQPSSGRILVDGEDISTVPPNKRPINMMFQSYALFPHMSVEKNIGFGLKQEKLSAAAIKKRVDEMLELVQLQSFAKRKPHQLSGGQKQRVALARSLAKSPKLLLLDEPLGALDKKLREQTQFELMSLQENLGLTFMIVTHDQEEAMTVASRIAVMDKGVVVQVDTPAAIYEQPNSRYVADFLGDANFIECKVLALNAPKALTEAQQSYTELHLQALQGSEFKLITEEGADDELKHYQPDDTLWLAIRPEKINVSKQAPDAEMNAVQGKVWDIAYSGNTSTYHVKLADDVMLKAQVANRRRLSNREITWEDDVWLSWTATAAIALKQ